jgi:hypothetical protein
LTFGEIQQKIKEYNAQINNNHFMVNVSEAVLHSFCTFMYMEVRLPWSLDVVLFTVHDDLCRIRTGHTQGS